MEAEESYLGLLRLQSHWAPLVSFLESDFSRKW